MKKFTFLLIFALMLTMTAAVLPQGNAQAGDGPNPHANPRAIDNHAETDGEATGGSGNEAKTKTNNASTDNNGAQVGVIKNDAGVEGGVGQVLQDIHEDGGLAVGQMTTDELVTMFETAAAEQVTEQVAEDLATATLEGETIIYPMTNGHAYGWWYEVDDLATLNGYPNPGWTTTQVYFATEDYADESGIAGTFYEEAYIRCNPSMMNCSYMMTGTSEFVPDVPLLPVVEEPAA